MLETNTQTRPILKCTYSYNELAEGIKLIFTLLTVKDKKYMYFCEKKGQTSLHVRNKYHNK